MHIFIWRKKKISQTYENRAFKKEEEKEYDFVNLGDNHEMILIE